MEGVSRGTDTQKQREQEKVEEGGGERHPTHVNTEEK